MAGSVELRPTTASGRPVVGEVQHDQEHGTRTSAANTAPAFPGAKFFATTICFTCPTAAPSRKIDDTMIVAN
jgi:hypothetical protein